MKLVDSPRNGTGLCPQLQLTSDLFKQILAAPFLLAGQLLTLTRNPPRGFFLLAGVRV